MGSDWNNKIPAPPQPAQCAAGCGLFGAAALMGLCLRCFRSLRLKERQEALAKAALGQPAVYPPPRVETISPPVSFPAEVAAEQAAASHRCGGCNKKVRVMGFVCRCGGTFCRTHRLPEVHGCTFDFKGQGRLVIARDNPVIKADKLQNRI